VVQWLEQNETVLIVGPEGAGKHSVFTYALEVLQSNVKTQVVTIYCNAQTNAIQIIQKL
jgi:ribose 1,5-bisphosphokinase PhnN